MKGYLNMGARSMLIYPEQALNKKSDQDTQDEETIKNEARRRIQEMFRAQGYLIDEPQKEEEPVEQNIDLHVAISQIITSFSPENFKDGASVQSLCIDKWIALLKQKLESTQLTYQEQRAVKIIMYLYELMVTQWDVSQRDITNANDDEIRMAECNASRLIAPLFKKFGIPSFNEMRTLIKEAVLLRVLREDPSISDKDLSSKINKAGFGYMGFKRRTLNKHRRSLQTKDKTPSLSSSRRDKFQQYFNIVIESGGQINEDDFAKEFKLSPTECKKILATLKNNHIERVVKKAFAANQEVDFVELALQLDMDLTETEERINNTLNILEGNFGLTASTAQPEEIIEEVGGQVNDTTQTTNLPTENHEPTPIHDPVPPLPEPGTDSTLQAKSTPVSTPEVESSTSSTPVTAQTAEPPVTPATPETSPETQKEHIKNSILRDPAYQIATLARDLEITTTEVVTLTRTIENEREIPQKRAHVLKLIQAQPGAGDREIEGQTGYSLLDIHLCVRPLLISGSIHKGQNPQP